MKASTKIYAAIVGIMGLIVGSISFYRAFMAFDPSETSIYISLGLLLFVCRNFPLYIREGCLVDMSFIGILTIFLVKGPDVASSFYLMTTLIIVRPSGKSDGKFSCILNSNPIKTLFNTGNILLTIHITGYFFRLCGGEVYLTRLPECLASISVYMLVSMIVNTVLMAILLAISDGAKFFYMIIKGFIQFLPNIICAAPIGFFFAYLINSDKAQGFYLTFLFMLPLLLARYSFKMYLETKAQSYKVIKALTAAIEAKDPYTVGHSRRVEEYSELIARQLKLSPRKVERIKIAALFHDIGKIGINDNILNKQGALSDSEFDTIRTHPSISAFILNDIDFYGDIKDVILCHHERYDGRGYPEKRGHGDVPFEAYIISVADAFDAMTSDRPYRKGFSIEKAIGIIAEESGKQFHPQAAEAIEQLYESGKLVILV